MELTGKCLGTSNDMKNKKHVILNWFLCTLGNNFIIRCLFKELCERTDLSYIHPFITKTY